MEQFDINWLLSHGNQSSDLRRMFLGLLRKKSLEEIFNETWPLARNNNL